MRVEAGHAAALRWLQERTGCVLTGTAKAVQAVDDTGRIRGVVGYDMWTVNAVQLHMAVDSPIVWRHLLRPALEYPFLQAGRSVLLGIIPASNMRSCAMARAAGFVESHRVRDGWAVGEDLVVHELRREDWRQSRKAGKCGQGRS
ncbi:hypothetical protein [Myxococcus landrumensis]|uniref:N-acetyltransferase domain-containing protein n=1 Tax=Myxococcus landrumensis TaxID=2813577 RepID=A0ABX7N5P8_9BACT|nr:hypothetical protein [Myxococcus landrumus]QSQ14045.1 hypothetical protein JY572_37985 [Myxococcus landrumus]